jgi:hypothetical protein
MHLQKEMVKFFAIRTVIIVATCGKAQHTETNFFEQAGKQPVQFIAKTTPPPDDDLVVQRIFIQPDRSPQVNVVVLEGHRQQMRSLQGA